jgi:O-antigen ligase
MANVSGRAVGVARASLIALGFSIPISAAADGVLTAAIVLAWLAAGRFRETVRAVRENPVAAMACVWLAVHALGALYSIGEARDVLRVLQKAATFLLVPIAVAMLVTARDRERARAALMWAIGLTIILSTLRWLGVIPADAPLLRETVFSATVVFKFQLTQNLLVAFGAFLFAVQSRHAQSARMRWAWAAAAALAAANVLMVGDGRIGQVVLFVLLVYFAWTFGNVRVIAIGGALTATVAAAAYLVPDSPFHRRFSEGFSEAMVWSSGVRPLQPSSIGDRFDYYVTSARIVADHPLAGVGTGGFPAAYEQQTAGTDLWPTRNPHNEYLLRAVELGAAGVLLLLALFVVVWRHASRLATPSEVLIARGLVIMFAVAGLASTPLADHTETLLFVWLVGVLFAGYRPARRDRAHPVTGRNPRREPIGQRVADRGSSVRSPARSGHTRGPVSAPA